MGSVLYLAAILLLLLCLQSGVLLAFREPLQWTFGASSSQPKSLRLVLKLVLQSTLIGSIFLFPYLVGTTPAAYYGPLFPAHRFGEFLLGEALALALLALIFAVESAGGWIQWKPRWGARKTAAKSLFSALSSLTVVAVEEPLFRGVILRSLLATLSPALAIPLGAVLFSGAHFIRRVSSYWPAVGLAVLGLWLGAAYARTGALWLPMGLHGGGILAIGVHRCFTVYRGPAWLVGTQTFPIAGLISIVVMLAGTLLTWFLF